MSERLNAVMKDVNKKAKYDILNMGLKNYNYERIPFTSPKMNWCTFGGIPVGKITEFFGEEHGGKTTSALDIIANYQRMPEAKDVLYVDAETRLDKEWAEKLGVDVEKMYVLQPDMQTAEDMFQIIYDAVLTGDVGLWVLDSIGVLFSEQELEKDMNESTVGGVSKSLTRFGKKIVAPMHKFKTTGIGINQFRDKIGSQYPQKTTVGGNAWRYYCTARLQFSRGQFIDEKGNALTKSADAPAGNIVNMSMEKNSTCPPTRRIGKYTINYETGVDYLKDLVDVAISLDIVQKSGAWFDIVNTKTGEKINDNKIQGISNVYELLEDNYSMLEQIEQLVNAGLKIDL